MSTKTPDDVVHEVSLAQNLPVEILSEVFRHSIPTSHAPSEKSSTLKQWQILFSDVYPMNLTGVCRSWRHVALETRVLWSTWFVIVDNPPKKALSMLECFLKRYIRRSGNLMLKFHVQFTGEFDSVQACQSVEPLLAQQERWEEAECHFEEGPGEDMELDLDFTKLKKLKKLRVGGPLWNFIGDDLEFDAPRVGYSQQLASLHSVEMIGLQSMSYYSILSLASGITELVISIRQEEIMNRGRIILPVLRRLVIQTSPTFGAGNMNQYKLLQTLESEALEEPSCHHIHYAHSVSIYEFVDRCGLSKTLSSLTLRFRDGVNPLESEEALICLSLFRLESLRTLAIHGELADVFISLLSTGVRNDNRPNLCPILEVLTLAKIESKDRLYTKLVEERWGAPARCIKSISFIDCKLAPPLPGNPLTGLTRILNVDTCVQEGLELNVHYNEDAT